MVAVAVVAVAVVVVVVVGATEIGPGQVTFAWPYCSLALL